jgi:hypothetical protein
MTRTEAIKVLTAHQKWRMGGNGKMTDPKTLTAATDEALRILSNKTECVKRSRYRKLQEEYKYQEQCYVQLMADASEQRMEIERLKGRNLFQRIFNLPIRK